MLFFGARAVRAAPLVQSAHNMAFFSRCLNYMPAAPSFPKLVNERSFTARPAPSLCARLTVVNLTFIKANLSKKFSARKNIHPINLTRDRQN